MRRFVGVLGITALIWLPASEGAEAPSTPAANSTPPAAPARPAPAFTPGFADLMSILVAPRHAKLYYAASAGNWELATFEVRSLRQGLRRAAQAVPRYLGNDVERTIASIMDPAMQATEAALAAGDPQKFSKAFGELTEACNACHSFLEHPFIVIKVPNAAGTSNYPNEEFKASP